MDSFVVSARKYRPATFDMVVGQRSITSTLKNAIRNNQLAQAFLFTGPRGVGKTTCARILAKTINCEHISENIEACNTCESCLSFNRSHSFNVHELDAASNNSVDGIRALVDQVRIPPQLGRYKVYIIDEVHMLSQAAFNAFLKTLEEPPAYAKFILATTERHKIIPTILSRCQIFDFARITIHDIIHQLQYVAEQEKVDAEHEALHIIAQKADGAMRDALSIFDQLVSFSGNSITYKQAIESLNVLDYDYYFRVLDFILGEQTSDMLLLIDEILQKGFEGSDFITGFGHHLRNLLVGRNAATVRLIESSDEVRKRYLDQSGRCQDDFLLAALDLNNRADVHYRTSSNKRLTLELALLQMAGLVKKKGQPEQQLSAGVLPTMRGRERPGSESAGRTSVTDTNTKPATADTPSHEKKDTSIQEPKLQAEPIRASISEEQKPAYGLKKIGDPLPEQPLNQVKGAEDKDQAPLQEKQQDKPEPVSDHADDITGPENKPGESSMQIPAGLSLKIHVHDDHDDDEVQDEAATYEELPGDEVSPERFIETWKKLAATYEKESHAMYQAMTKYEPLLNKEGEVVVFLDNSIQQDIIAERKTELTGRLRKELNNYSLFIETRIKDNGFKQKAYLPKEKLEKLLEKNPLIGKLKKELDLDFDY